MNLRSLAYLFAAAAGTTLAVHFLPDLLGPGLTGVDAGDLAASANAGKFGIAYLGGVLTSLTPCVYPLIPITVSVFGARKAESRLKGFLLVTCYVMGIATTFSALGFAAASSGAAFGTFLANRWVLVGLAAFFVVMATSMFGAFDLALPPALMGRLNRVGGTGWFGAFAMGLVAGIVAAPCTGPVLTSLLGFVATSGQPLFGVSLLFVHALGIGLPFFLIGAFSVSLPKSGAWMDGVKSIFGLALLALALTYLRDAIPAFKPLLLAVAPFTGWVALLAGAGVLLGAVHRSYHGGFRERALKTVGVALVVVGVFFRVSAHAAPADVRWVDDPELGLTTAKAEGKPVMMDFTADWCAACKELERYTYVDAAVAAEAARFVNVRVDSTVEDDRIQALQARYGIRGLPTVVFIDSTGAVLEKPRVTGFVAAPEYLGLMQQVR